MIIQKKSLTFWRGLESAADGTPLDTARLLAALRFNRQGLIPVIAQCSDSRRVLMHAWMNREALTRTLSSGRMHYYSRSRRTLWEKGETSGNTQTLVGLSADCDGDTLLAEVQQRGGACHTGRPSCFYLQIFPAGAIDNGKGAGE